MQGVDTKKSTQKISENNKINYNSIDVYRTR